MMNSTSVDSGSNLNGGSCGLNSLPTTGFIPSFSPDFLAPTMAPLGIPPLLCPPSGPFPPSPFFGMPGFYPGPLMDINKANLYPGFGGFPLPQMFFPGNFGSRMPFQAQPQMIGACSIAPVSKASDFAENQSNKRKYHGDDGDEEDSSQSTLSPASVEKEATGNANSSPRDNQHSTQHTTTASFLGGTTTVGSATLRPQAPVTTPSGIANAAATNGPATTGNNSDQTTDNNNNKRMQLVDNNNNNNIRKETKKPEPWSEKEHKLFLYGMKVYGKRWRTIAREVLTTRSSAQISSHAQKYFEKLNRTKKQRQSIFQVEISENDLKEFEKESQKQKASSNASAGVQEEEEEEEM